jgi:hypothetical protein
MNKRSETLDTNYVQAMLLAVHLNSTSTISAPHRDTASMASGTGMPCEEQPECRFHDPWDNVTLVRLKRAHVAVKTCTMAEFHLSNQMRCRGKRSAGYVH